MVWVVDLSRRETFNCGSLKPELTTFSVCSELPRWLTSLLCWVEPFGASKVVVSVPEICCVPPIGCLAVPLTV